MSWCGFEHGYRAVLLAGCENFFAPPAHPASLGGGEVASAAITLAGLFSCWNTVLACRILHLNFCQRLFESAVASL